MFNLSCDVAFDGQIGIQKVQERLENHGTSYDLILVDMYLMDKNFNGLKTVAKIREIYNVANESNLDS